jgi:hypothetical protein
VGAFEAGHTTLPKLIAAYVASGLVVGVVVGLLLPLARWKSGAAVIGMVATIPYMLLIRHAMSDMGPWSCVDTIIVGHLTVFFGSGPGAVGRGVKRVPVEVEK